MKTLVFTAILMGLSLPLSAQEGRVSIQQDPKIDELVKLYTEVSSKAGYYQIQVGFGNFQKAQNLKSQVDIDFPDWYSKIEFESPTYRVRLGRFKTKLEAERKYLEVRKKYPDAMLLKPSVESKS
ncbi:Sporulation related domain-containing protein [Flagellimonas taeanensis]|jgi:cell division protein FtsN|uniref:Sporulation related domain-containing protein n=1 Tax=Flagellimonas taeanensis TaxID=1005926 RepID=A0A1M6TG49_9FLAO|nr:SPOR domain-containing protein [Allomuricauda taeanensis]MEE1962188.1 SPOR domain-containing protein [Allomuricauda taeanensis]SFB88031.1 Sporulation related domain-containing protein [Allomuricauda taeanensis]SHK55884.1 Sporulation related domain-containing protein [Allomuricauda taeanensis]